MGTTTTTNLLTFEEFERLPDRPGKLELLEGELIELPPATIKHDRRSRRIFQLLTRALDAAHRRGQAAELGEVCIESGYKLSRKTYVKPDVSVTHAAQREGDYLEGAPAIAIEVMSPSNRTQETATKTQLYFRYGAREVWRFYANTRHVEVHVRKSVRIERAIVTTPLLPGFVLKIAQVFDSPKL